MQQFSIVTIFYKFRLVFKRCWSWL